MRIMSLSRCILKGNREGKTPRCVKTENAVKETLTGGNDRKTASPTESAVRGER